MWMKRCNNKMATKEGETDSRLLSYLNFSAPWPSQRFHRPPMVQPANLNNPINLFLFVAKLMRPIFLVANTKRKRGYLGHGVDSHMVGQTPVCQSSFHNDRLHPLPDLGEDPLELKAATPGQPELQ